MTPYLLDVNVLIALAWPNHMHHGDAVGWFAAKARGAFRTCPMTQTAFVRISSNPAFTPDAVTPAGALELLGRVMALPGHAFWPDDLVLAEAVRPGAYLAGHRQVTDVYLLALAARHGGVLATLDRGAAGVAKTHGWGVEWIG